MNKGILVPALASILIISAFAGINHADAGLVQVPIKGKFIGTHDSDSWKSVGKYFIDGEKFRKVQASGDFAQSEVGGCKTITAEGTISLLDGDLNVLFDLEKCVGFKYLGTFEVTSGTGAYEGMIGSGESTVIASKKLFVGGLSGVLEPDVVPADPPSIDPTSGDNGAFFTITDPQGRIQLGDQALFYDPLAGGPDLVGVNADNIVISTDGTTLSGTVPFGLPISNGALLVSVKVPGEPSRFTDLPFQITGEGCPPNCGGGF